jgi:hypothetical protein
MGLPVRPASGKFQPRATKLAGGLKAFSLFTFPLLLPSRVVDMLK